MRSGPTPSSWRQYEQPDHLLKLKCHQDPAPVKIPVATNDDLAAMLATCNFDDLSTGLRDCAIIVTLAHTGMRRSELARMRWEDVDLTEGTLVLPRTKNGTVRTVRLSRDALRAVKRYAREQIGAHDRPLPPYVWESGVRREQLSSDAIAQMHYRRAARAGVEISAHALRRGFAMHWLRNGFSQVYLQKIAGWKSPVMVQRYVSAVAEQESLAQHALLFP